METFRIKPTSKTKVLDPITYQPLKPTGEEKPKNAYWLNRVKDGDVEIIKPKLNSKTTTGAKS